MAKGGKLLNSKILQTDFIPWFKLIGGLGNFPISFPIPRVKVAFYGRHIQNREFRP